MNPNGNMETVTASSLLEDLKSSDSKVKINAIKSLNVVAFALGKDRTRNELLPFLADCIDEEEDETLIELARVLVSFLDFIGGKAQANKLFKILELLLILDEQSVRNEALITFKTILSQVNPADYEADLMDLINRLSSSEYINQRQSAINLIPVVFVHMSGNNKTNLVSRLLKFANEEAPMIKRDLAASLKDYTNYIDEELYSSLVNIFIKDTNDTVRIPIMESVVGLKNHPKLANFEAFIITVIKQLTNDESWRVRLTVADKIHEILNFSPLSQNLKATAVEVFAKLLDDKEAETRNICCLKLEVIAEKIGKEDLMDQILGELKKVEKDSVSYVRGALASTLLRICPLIGKTKTNDFVFPVFLNIIKDENHDIRMTIIKTLDRLHEVINIDIFVQSIIPSLLEIATNKSWRIRIQITESIPVLARILNKNLFLDNILGLCVTWLTDGVYAIREAACKLMKKLYDIFKGEEFEKRIIEKLNEMRNNNSYLIRNTVLFLAKEFSQDEFDFDFLEKKMLPLIIKSSKDRISNVRMNAAIVLKKMLRNVKSKDVLKEVQYCCDELKRDIDSDVVNALIDN